MGIDKTRPQGRYGSMLQKPEGLTLVFSSIDDSRDEWREVLECGYGIVVMLANGRDTLFSLLAQVEQVSSFCVFHRFLHSFGGDM